MAMLVILATMVGAALVAAAVAHIRQSRKNKEPILLGVGRSSVPGNSGSKGGDRELRRSLSDWRCTATAHWRRLLSRRRPRHFCLWLQQESGNNRDACTGGRSGHGRTTRRSRVQRVGSDVGRIRERPDSTTGLRLHRQAK